MSDEVNIFTHIVHTKVLNIHTEYSNTYSTEGLLNKAEQEWEDEVESLGNRPWEESSKSNGCDSDLQREVFGEGNGEEV